jgi:endonuclease III
MKVEVGSPNTARLSLDTVADILIPIWPDARPLLEYSSCFELLCSVILSAQTTDEQVNEATPGLFKAFPDPEAMAKADIGAIEGFIRTVGFYHVKARYLSSTARILVERHDSTVPKTMEELLELPGVGRKAANLVLSACTGTPGVIVDTHVMRAALRLGLCGKRDPTAIEMAIREGLGSSKLTAFSHALNRHGKFVCKARSPACTVGEPCPLSQLCPRIGVEASL